MIEPIVVSTVFACWGSFLNVVGYRLIHGISLLGRSQCVSCHSRIAWYDLIPLISYVILRGRCRSCHERISPLYPFIELVTAVSLTGLYYGIEAHYFGAYFLFFSALIVTIRTDLETMLIARLMTLPLIPLGFILSCTDHIPLIPLDSILGTAVGFFSLWLISTLFYLFTRKQGIGEGDFELLALIGSFTGMFGVWAALMIGAIMGSITSLAYLTYTGKLERHAKIPFGPFLAFGAMCYVLLEEYMAPFFWLSY